MKYLRETVIAGAIATTVLVGAATGDSKTTDIVVKVGDGAGYRDGDIIHAFPEKRILDVHAQHVVHPKNMPRTENGTIQEDSLLEKYLEETQEFKFERISETEVRRTNLWTDEEEVFSNTPNARGEQMDVALYIQRRISLNPADNKIFGQPGSEYWYGGSIRVTDASMDEVWDEIEDRTSHERQKDFPFTENERRAFVVMKVENLTDEEARELVSPELDEQGEVIRERKHRVNFSRMGLTARELQDLSNKEVSHDFRRKNPVKVEDILR